MGRDKKKPVSAEIVRPQKNVSAQNKQNTLAALSSVQHIAPPAYKRKFGLQYVEKKHLMAAMMVLDNHRIITVAKRVNVTRETIRLWMKAPWWPEVIASINKSGIEMFNGVMMLGASYGVRLLVQNVLNEELDPWMRTQTAMFLANKMPMLLDQKTQDITTLVNQLAPDDPDGLEEVPPQVHTPKSILEEKPEWMIAEEADESASS